MEASCRSLIVNTILVACLCAPAGAWGDDAQREPSRDYEIGTAGGVFSGPDLRMIGSIGLLTTGISIGDSVRHPHGFLPAFAKPDLELDAARVDFGLVDLSATRTIELRNFGGVTLTLDEVTIEGGAPFTFVVQGPLQLPPGEISTVEVTFSPTSDGSFSDLLVIATNETGLAVRRIPLSGAACAPRVAEVAGSIDFGAVGINNQVTRELLIRNEGCRTLNVGPLELVTPYFEASPRLSAIEPGGEVIVTITFRPDAPSAVEDTLRIPTDDPLRTEPLSVSLVGTGTLLLGLQAPEIVSTGEAAPIVVLLAGASLPDSATLFYRLGGEGSASYRAVPMSVSAGRAEAEIPDTASGIAGVEFYARVVVDGVAFQVSDPEDPERIAVELSGEEATSPELAGLIHHIVAFPLATGGPGALDILADDLGPHSINLWRFGHYDHDAPDAVREFPASLGAPLEAGYGFWLIARSPPRFDADGISVFPTLTISGTGDYFPIALDSPAGGDIAATQIGNPYAYPVLWEDCRIRHRDNLLSPAAAADSGLIDSGLYDYVGAARAYRLADRLEPWKGYFVGCRTTEALDLLVPDLRADEGPKRVPETAGPASDGRWELVLSTDLSGESGSRVTIGCAPDARDGWDRFDHFQPPGPTAGRSGLALYGGDLWETPTPLSSDYRNASGEIQVWFLRVDFPTQTEQNLVVQFPSPLRESQAVLLVDSERGQIMELRADSPVRLLPLPGHSVREYRIVAGAREALEDLGIEATRIDWTFCLLPAAPNPVRDRTSIRYSIPFAGPTRLSVFDVSGRIVKRLVDGVQEEGFHALEWDCGEGRDRELPSGLYFVRLEHDSRIASIRLIKQR